MGSLITCSQKMSTLVGIYLGEAVGPPVAHTAWVHVNTTGLSFILWMSVEASEFPMHPRQYTGTSTTTAHRETGCSLYNTPPLSFCPWWGHQVLGRCVFQMLPMHEHSHWCPNFGDQQHFPCGRTTRLATPWSREVKTLPEDTRRCSWQM